MNPADSNPNHTAPPGQGGRRRRRRRRKPNQPASPAAVVARAKPNEVARSADEPLTPGEVAELRQHFRFLREYRKVLRLRLNAAEDLLVNEAREPTSRGVCQHLFSKIDRARVSWAVDQLEPADATRLVEGVLRICPDLEYVLLYLECVKRSATQTAATAALARGLERIDFAQVSHAQMRRVLDLIVELFDERQFPELLISLLEGRAFRQAFDESADSLPSELARFVVPLRAVQAVVLHGRRNDYEASVLAFGVNLLLAGDERVLLGYSAEIRRRLYDLGLQSCAAAEHPAHKGLKILLRSFSDDRSSHADMTQRLARHLLEAGEEREAQRSLESLGKERPDLQWPGRWLEVLGAPRVDQVALPRLPNGPDSFKPNRRYAGWWVRGMHPVWVVVGSSEQRTHHQELAGWHRELCLPGVAPLLFSGESPGGVPYLVLPHPGKNLAQALDRRGGLTKEAALGACADGVLILGALATAGFRLRDAHPRRFDLLADGRLSLVDLEGASRAPTEQVAREHASLATALCQGVLSRARYFIPPPPLVEALAQNVSLAELSHRLEHWRWATSDLARS